MDEIVVAKKANMLAAYITFIVLGTALIALGIVFGVREDGNNKFIYIGFFGILGLIFIAIGIWQIIKYKKMPKNLITYKDGLFTFADGTTCNPNEITHVLVKLTRQNGIVNSTGGLVITINGTRKIEYQNISNVQNSQNEIQRITEEYNARLYQEAQAAEAARQAPADPFEEMQPASTVEAVEPVSSDEPIQPADDGKSEN